MSRRKQITAQDINDLFIDAMGGDSEALISLRDSVRKLAKRANQQMLVQERRGVEGESYRRAQSFLGNAKRYKENVKGLDIEQLKREADSLISFTSAKDYSIPYLVTAHKQIEKMSGVFSAMGIDITEKIVTFRLNELFKTGAWKEFRKAHGRSTDLIKAAADEFRQGRTVDDLLSAYNDYIEGRDDLVQSWNKFAPGTW